MCTCSSNVHSVYLCQSRGIKIRLRVCADAIVTVGFFNCLSSLQYFWTLICSVLVQVRELFRDKRSAPTLNRVNDVKAVDIATTFNLNFPDVQEVFHVCDGECAERLA